MKHNGERLGGFKSATRILSVIAVILLTMVVIMAGTGNFFGQGYKLHKVSADGKVDADMAMVRSGPGISYEVIGRLKSGEPVIINGWADNKETHTIWYKIQFYEQEGFVRSDLIMRSNWPGN